MTDTCTHLDQVTDVTPSSDGCEDCLRIGGRWVHLRMCMSCGHIGCCDNSPNRHATAHYRATAHPIIQSYEPGEDWWYCYIDDLAFVVDGAPSFVHPGARPSPTALPLTAASSRRGSRRRPS